MICEQQSWLLQYPLFAYEHIQHTSISVAVEMDKRQFRRPVAVEVFGCSLTVYLDMRSRRTVDSTDYIYQSLFLCHITHYALNMYSVNRLARTTKGAYKSTARLLIPYWKSIKLDRNMRSKRFF